MFLCVFQCVVVSLEDACKGLILCCLALEFVSLSQRFFPEMLNFLLGLLHLTVPDKSSTGVFSERFFSHEPQKYSHCCVNRCHVWL